MTMITNLMTKLTTIRARLTLWYTFFLALTVAGFSVYLHLELQDSLSIQIDEGLRVAASHLLVDVDDSVNPPALRPMSEQAEEHLLQSSFALRLVEADGTVAADVGRFPPLAFFPPADTASETDFQTVVINTIPWRIYTQQIETQTSRFNVWLQMGQSLNIIQELENNLLRLILFGLPVIVLVASLGGIFLANRALNPVDSITRTVQAITATDMTRRIPFTGPADELGRLTTTLNSMLDRIESAFEAERRFTADASHELRTPLTAIKGQVGVTLTRQRSPHEYENALKQIQYETDRLIRLANDLLFLARLDVATLRGQPERINLSDLLEALVEQVKVLAADKTLTLNALIPPDVVIQGTADHLIRLFLNLMVNAIKYTPAGGQITVTLTSSAAEVQISIRDTGIGIADAHLPHLFERFYRVESERTYNGSGAGLGLAIAHQITRAHDGAITVQSETGKGTEFTVHLPSVSAS